MSVRKSTDCMRKERVPQQSTLGRVLRVHMGVVHSVRNWDSYCMGCSGSYSVESCFRGRVWEYRSRYGSGYRYGQIIIDKYTLCMCTMEFAINEYEYEYNKIYTHFFLRV